MFFFEQLYKHPVGRANDTAFGGGDSSMAPTTRLVLKNNHVVIVYPFQRRIRG